MLIMGECDVVVEMANVTFSGKWSTLKDVNIKNQVQMHLIFDVNVFESTPVPRQRHARKISMTNMKDNCNIS